jgi:adenosylcobinamide-GDP ribazoletransferase
MLKKEIDIFFTALMFYTRIPCPKWITHHPDYLNKATKYFPVIGWLVGAITALVFYVAHFFLPAPLAVLLAMLAGVLTTGAFHEDGWADTCDGFGGGWTTQKILDIMKDSRLGTYGAVGLFFMLATKYYCLTNFNLLQFIVFSVVAHTFSRLCAVLLIATSSYVRLNEDAKAKPLAKQITKNEFLPALFFGLLPLTLASIFATKLALATIAPLLMVLYLRHYFTKWIGGYTGDCLGATQQITELLFYIGVIALNVF